MSTRAVQRALRQIGWPVQVDGVFGPSTKAAVRDFQRGYTFERLGSSGRAGPRTRAALRACAANGGRCSEHFRFREFRSKGDGWIKVDRALVHGLERYRSLLGRPVTIVSGYRDPAHNAAVGGASSSQHLFGNAADISPALSLSRVGDLRAFSGIGVDATTGLVRHIDVRHRGPNPTAGTLAHPTVFVE